ncbi:hypothetical protein SAMD00019534_104500 [Acytostelium subglobosum LB1]|uniref:hypothetical protein n=1 Tax=Acytostelium subglobosum LB1 TaxID=1410327 RepID=UPI000644FCD0|nr:hypothetical protein SAMD00019534_104500 [Acytostelium subglobosum LB1]GAM27275.1 hypothetical protein SAMD00019534_104500 [Acytostelium subglobosum LB1]|eukprot:XP_012749742.1 hypothetical protein SAMD00019534_104500 [Acytostelium subglobosum LB1]
MAGFIQKIKNVVAGGPSKSDSNFEGSRKEFKLVGEYIIAIDASLKKRVKNLRKTFIHPDCVSKTIVKYFNNDHPLALNCVESSKLIENSFNAWNDSQQSNYETISRMVARVKSIKDSISARDQYLMDLENSDTKLKSLREKPPKDVSKLPAEEANNKLKRGAYQTKNQSTMSEIHQFFEDKPDNFDIPLMHIQESMSQLFSNIHNNLLECSELLQKPPPYTNPITIYLSDVGNNDYSGNTSVSNNSISVSKSPSSNSLASPPQQSQPKPVAVPAPQPVVESTPAPPQLQGPPVDLDKPIGPFTKKKLMVHNDVLFKPPQQPVALEKHSSSGTGAAAPVAAAPAPVSLKSTSKSNSFTQQSSQPQQTPTTAKSASFIGATPVSKQPAANTSTETRGVLPSQVRSGAATTTPIITPGIVTRPAPQSNPPVSAASAPAPTQSKGVGITPTNGLAKPPQQPSVLTKPKVGLAPTAPTTPAPAPATSKAPLMASNKAGPLSANFAKHKELYGSHKKFKLVQTLNRSSLGIYDFGTSAPNLKANRWSIIMPAPPSSLAQNVRSSGLEVYDYNGKFLANAEVVPTDYHYVYRALLPTDGMADAEKGRIKAKFIIEADLYKVSMVETQQWDPNVTPLQQEELSYYTRASETYTLDDPIFVDFVQSNNLVVQSDETALCFAYRVNLFFNEYFKYNDEHGWKPITTTITIKKGDCGCLALLYNSVLRKQGIPARSIIGRGGDYNSDTGVQPHCKSEVYIENIGWVPVDVTWNLTHRDKYFGHDCGELICFHIDEVCNIDYGVCNLIKNHSIIQKGCYAAEGSGNFDGSRATDQWTVRPLN